MQVVHLPVVVWSREVVRAETAEEQSQEEVQQLETEKDSEGETLSLEIQFVRQDSNVRQDVLFDVTVC